MHKPCAVHDGNSCQTSSLLIPTFFLPTARLRVNALPHLQHHSHVSYSAGAGV